MRKAFFGLTLAVMVSMWAAGSLVAQNGPAANPNLKPHEDLPWAYPMAPPPPPGQAPGGGRGRGAPDPTILSLPDSPLRITRSQISGYNIPDWYPQDHPPAPNFVLHGRQPDVQGCGFCHLANGQGRPENSSLVGLSADYIVQQMADFQSGARASAEPRPNGPSQVMIRVAKATTPYEARLAAEYFQSVKPKKWIRVVETAMVPKTRGGQMLTVIEPEEKEPIGNNIIEVAEDLEKIEMRDTRTGFVAYVPPGSIKKGEALVKAGNCAVCHGADLRGIGPVPALAGRSPSQMGRSLYDFTKGVRTGVWTPLMKEAAAKLTPTDIVNLTAYIASLNP